MQAAPRQRPWCSTHHMASADAPRAGSAEAKVLAVHVDHAIHDAPRAGSAEAKVGLLAGATVSGPMHPVQAAHSEITTCRPMVL